MKFRFALLVGLLFAASFSGSFANEDGDPTTVTSDATTPAADVTTTQTGGDASTSAGGSTGAAGSTVTPDPSATTVSAGPAASTVSVDPSATTVSGGTVAPTAPVTGAGGSTVSQAPTTPAPLPNVTYTLLQFGAPVCVDQTCTYEIDAPGNNQTALALDQTAIGNDRTQFNALQQNATAKDAAVKKANDDALAKIQQLQSLLNTIQSNLDWIQNATKTIQSQQNAAKANLQLVESFINKFNENRDLCLYQRCLKPTTPAPPTTPTTPAPTTPPSPCLNYTCPNDPLGTAHCQLDGSNKAYCDNCLGDFDGYNHCDTISCSASGLSFVVDSSTNSATWYSTGYNSANSTSSVVPANANCVWNLPVSLKFQVDATGFSLSCLTSQNVAITFKSADGGFSQSIASTSTVRVLNNLLGKVVNGSITLTSTALDQSFCSIPLKPVTASSEFMMMGVEGEEIVEEQKKNGFFSWLMGY